MCSYLQNSHGAKEEILVMEPSQRQILRQKIQAIEARYGRRVFLFVGPIRGGLARHVLNECRRALKGCDPEETMIDVILHSGGGSADDAYHAALVLRRYSKHVRVCVPLYAKSAATLFSLSADEIMMSEIAELGPLDAQVTDPRNPAKQMSALDGYRSVDYILEYALHTQNVVVNRMLDRTAARMPLPSIIEHANSFIHHIVSPIASQILPLDFGGWGRTLDIGRDYAIRLLTRYARMDDTTARIIAYNLVYSYPHHGFIIDIDEAATLGLNVRAMDHEYYDLAIECIMFAQEHFGLANGEEQWSGYIGFAPDIPEEHGELSPVVGLQSDGAAGKTRSRVERKAATESNARAKHDDEPGGDRYAEAPGHNGRGATDAISAAGVG